MNRLLQDVRYALRQMRGNPGFTAVAILTLALGIGVNSAIFSVIEAVILRPLPFSAPDRLVWLNGKFPQSDEASVSPPDFSDCRAQNRSFEQLGAMGYWAGPTNLSGDKPEQVITTIASANFFGTLGIRPLLGRDFFPSDEHVNTPQVAILGYGLWKRNFGGDPKVVGRTIGMDGQSLTVVGVLPSDLPLLTEAQMWLPSPMLNPGMNIRIGHSFKMIGRLKPAVTLDQSQADLDAIAVRLAKQYPNTNEGWSLRQRPLRDVLVGPVRPALLLMWGAATILLLIASVNVANLLLARSIARHKEFALRSALGASCSRMIQQMLTESVLLAIAGGTLGVLAATGGLQVLRAAGPSSIPRLDEVHINAPVLIFTICISLLTGIVFGLAPAWRLSGSGFSEGLKESARTSASLGHKRLSRALVVGEIAASLTLLVGAGLLLKSFWRLIHVNPGFQTEHVMTARLRSPKGGYDDPQIRVRFWQQVEEQMNSLPGVEGVGATSVLPLSGEHSDNPFHIPGRSYRPSEFDDAEFRQVTPGYLLAMRIPLFVGRWLDENDNADSAGVMIVNQAFVKRFFSGGDALGKRLQLMGDTKPMREIVGVVGNISHSALSDPQQPEMYVPYAQYSPPNMEIVVRASGNHASLAAALREVISAIDKDVTLSQLRSMDDVMDASIAQPRFSSQLLALFAALALVLAAIGIYGVMAYSVTQRTNEIGIRMALGAQRTDVLKMIDLQGMKLALAGVAIGVAAAFAVTRLMASLLYGVKATDLLTFILASIGLAGVALLANYLPARRAAKVDPMVALRYE